MTTLGTELPRKSTILSNSTTAERLLLNKYYSLHITLSVSESIGRLIFSLLFISIFLGHTVFLSKQGFLLKLTFALIALLVGGTWFFERISLFSEIKYLERALTQPEIYEEHADTILIFQEYVKIKYEIEHNLFSRISRALGKIEPLIWICVLIVVLFLIILNQALT